MSDLMYYTDPSGAVFRAMLYKTDGASQLVVPSQVGNPYAEVIDSPTHNPADVPATLTLEDADGNTEALFLYGPVVVIDDTLTIDADRMTIEDGDGLGFGNQWGGQIPAVPAGAFTVTVDDNAIGEFELGVSYSKAWN